MVLETDITQGQLLKLIKERSYEGFCQVHQQYASIIYFVINRIVQDAVASESLLLDSFVKVWKDISTYDESNGSLHAWIIGIARTRGKDYLTTQNN
jgi:RNA polymerase sigma-70 factor (ECF subfamily)